MAHKTSAEFPNFVSKEAMIAEIRRLIEPNCPHTQSILERINSTDFDLLADKSTTNFTI